MLNYDPVASLQHYPISGGMSRFGLSPFKTPLYRVVFAPSRRYLVVSESDGTHDARWPKKYRGLITETLTDGREKTHSNVWIMERWLAAEEFHKFGRADWDLNCLSLGPWPEKGEYELCYVFYPAPPADVSIEYRIKLIEASRKVPFRDTLNYQRDDSEKNLKSTRATAEDMIRNRLPAFGTQPMIGRGGGRGTKTAPILRTAQELGLPSNAGMVSNGTPARWNKASRKWENSNPVTKLIEAAA